MAKESRRKLLFIMVFLIILLSYSAYASSIPSVRAAEISTQEKGLAILKDVVGLNLTKYTMTSKECPQDSYFDVVPEENVGYNLESNESKLNMFCTFANGKLHVLHVLETEGSPRMTKPATSVLEMAKDFLDNYEGYSGNSFYGELSSMLDKVDANKNLTITSRNVKLEVTASEDYTTFSWTYTFNGVGAGDKCIALGYKSGFLKYFVDTWDLYKIGSTAVNLSEEEAVAIAMERAKTHSWKVGSGNNTFEVKDFKVTKPMVTQLVFCTSLYADKARSDDPLTLYPMWRIGVGLDKFYPGNVYGIYVDIWADTKEIRHVQETFSTLDPELVGSQLFDESNAVSIVWAAFPVVAIVVLGTAPICLSRKKNSSRLYNLSKLRSFGITIGLLCLLLSSAVLLVPISKVNAENRRATIWGDREFNKPDLEKSLQDLTASNVKAYFSSNGYVASNYQGSATVKANILYQIGDSEQNYPNAAVVYFDHGVGSENPLDGGNWHYQVLDNSGESVYDMDIYDQTALGKTFFAFISTCMSADLTFAGPYGGGHYASGAAVGMPYAWTHRIVKNRDASGFNTAEHMSDNGYSRPDNGAFCYIGFPWGSASLSQLVDENHTSSYYYLWVREFFYQALADYGYTVRQALDKASLEYFSSNFFGTRLYNDFTAVWPGFPEGQHSRMVVYGNGNLRLWQPALTVWAHTNYEYIDARVYVDGQDVGLTNTRIHVAPGYHMVGVSSPGVSSAGNAYFQYFEDEHGYLSDDNPVNVSITSWMDKAIIAKYNTAPSTPSINGPSPPMYVGEWYVFSACSTDPDDDDIQYEFNWDDDTSTTTYPYTSGATAYASHHWSSPGTYMVKVRAYDPSGLWSESQPLTVNIVYSTWTCNYCGATFTYEPDYCPYCCNSYTIYYAFVCQYGHQWVATEPTPCPYCGTNWIMPIGGYYQCNYCGKKYYPYWNGCYHSSFTPS